MKNLLFIAIMLLFTTAISAQNVRVSGNKIVVDGKEIAVIERLGCRAASPNCIYYIRNSEDKLLITIVEMDMIDPAEQNHINTSGMVRYLRFSFADDRGIAEILNPAMLNTRPIDIARILASARLISENELNESAVRNFIQAHGRYFSDRERELNKNRIIIHY